jgi:hypothetical protein
VHCNAVSNSGYDRAGYEGVDGYTLIRDDAEKYSLVIIGFLT